MEHHVAVGSAAVSVLVGLGSKRGRDFETFLLGSCEGTNPGSPLKIQRSVAVSIFVTNSAVYFFQF